MINRKEALELIALHVQNVNSIKHMMATEAIMKALAEHFNENSEIWSRAGLLHDLDMEMVDYEHSPELHALKTVEILQNYDVPQIVLDAILAHNEATGKSRNELIEKCIYSADPVTGLIVAATLVSPAKKIVDLSVKSLKKRFKDKHFAAGADRDIIKACTEFNMELDEFLAISLKAMQSISNDLGL